MECFIYFLFVVNEIDYIREDVEIVNDFLLLIVVLENVDKDIFFLVFILDIWKRLEKFSIWIEEIRSWLNVKILYSGDYKKVMFEENIGGGSLKNGENCLWMMLIFNGDLFVLV